mgnify:CR=1 FL=1
MAFLSTRWWSQRSLVASLQRGGCRRETIFHIHLSHPWSSWLWSVVCIIFPSNIRLRYRLAGAQYTEESKAKGLEGPLPPIFSQSCQRIFCAWASKMQLQNIKCYEGILHHKEFSMLELAFYALTLLLLESSLISRILPLACQAIFWSS